MDFDPSEFLAMAMSEDQNAVYTAPDLPEPCSSGTMTVEGGLQMEQGLQIPIPTFGMLDLHNHEEVVENVNGMTVSNEAVSSCVAVNQPVHIAMHESDNTSQPSPIESTASPHPLKRAIPTTYEETRFRKELFCGNFARVKLFRLHCTICDKHLGCAPWFTERQMRMHKLLNVAVCRKCFEFYGDINFPVEEESELFCCWCGEGGEVFCCSTCPKTVCKKCVKRNFGQSKVKEIEDNDNWACFVCKPTEIWPHRALFWGWQRFSKEMRQNVVNLPKEVRREQLSKDTSHCCPKLNEEFPPVNLPYKRILDKIPACMIAVTHQTAARNQTQVNTQQNGFLRASLNIASPAINSFINQPSTVKTIHMFQPTSTSSPAHAGPPTLVSHSRMLTAQPPPSIYNHSQQTLNRGAVNRPSPYPIFNQQVSRLPYLNRPVAPINTNFPQRGPPVLNRTSAPAEVIDLIGDSSFKQVLSKAHTPENDIKWLEKGISEVKDCLLPIRMLLEQFDLIRHDLIKDFSKLTTYSDRLSYNIKIAICNLAKINQNMVETKQIALDNKVKSVVNEIQENGVSTSVSKNRATQINVENKPIPIPNAQREVNLLNNPKDSLRTSPKVGESMDCNGPEQVTQASSTEEDIGDLTPALLCEAVLEPEGNKENENSNKRQSTPVKKTSFKKKGK